MNVCFATAEMAATYSSERELARRWGSATGRRVGRRLLELAAADDETLARLPGARVERDGPTGKVIIFFGRDIVVSGFIESGGSTVERHALPTTDRFVIDDLRVLEGSE